MELSYLQVFPDKVELLEPFSLEERGELFTALCQYAFTGEEPVLETNARFIWPVFRQMVDQSVAAIERLTANGKKGGRPKTKDNQTETKANQTETYENQEETKDEPSETKNNHYQESRIMNQESRDMNHDSRDKEREGGEAPPTPPSPTRAVKAVKHKYGEHRNVLLTDEELDKLKAKFPDWQNRINNLSWHIGKKGDKYKSHYLTILDWARRDEQQPARAAPSQPKGNYYNPFLEMAGGNVL